MLLSLGQAEDFGDPPTR